MSEATHFYDGVTGEPFYLDDPANAVTCKNGNTRQPYVKEALAWGKVPSVTTADIRMKWGLVNWMQEQAVRACFGFNPNSFSVPSIDNPEEEYVEVVMRHLWETKGERSGSDMGTEIHDAIESEIKGVSYPEEYKPHVEGALNEVARLFPDVGDWISERTFAHPLGYGGKTDLHSPGSGIVVDFKSFDGEVKEGRDGRPRKVFDGKTRGLVSDQNIQLAAYHQGLGLSVNVCANVFVSRTHPGVVASYVWDLDDLAKGWDKFRLMLRLWYLEHEATPSAVLEAAAAA